MTLETVQEMKAAHRTLAEFSYPVPKVHRGYAGQTLYVNIATGQIEARPVTDEMKRIFVGGKGFGLWRLWHAVTGETKWNDPENEIVIGAGPIAGTALYPGTGKSLVVTISPLTHIVVDSNVGGYFGPLLKFAGWDALEVQGKADQDVIIFIDGDTGRVTIEEAPLEGVDTYPLSDQLTEMYSKGESDRRNVSVVSAGQGSEHTRIGCLNVSWYDPKRGKARVKQAGRGGIGTVLRDKKIKAIVVRYTGMRADSNDPADLKRIRAVGQRINKEIVELDDEQNKMRRVGTAHLVEIMDDYDLLPTHNFKFGAHPDSPKINSLVWDALFTQTHPDSCIYGCTMACSKGVDGYLVRTGPYAGQIVTVDGPEYETVAGCGSNIGIFNPPDIIELNFYCDTYGIDSISFGTLTAFVMECYEAGILDKEKTGGLELRFGNADAAIELLHRMARGRGVRADRGHGRAGDESLLRRALRRRSRVRPGHRHGKQGDGVLRVHDQGEPGAAGRLRHDQQGRAARRGLADLHGHGEQPDPDLRGQGRGAALLPDVAHLVRAERAVQAAVERHRAGRQRAHRRAGQGARARGELRRALLRHHRGGSDQRRPDLHVGAGLQLPARLQPAHGPRHARARRHPLPLGRPGDGGGVREPR